MGQRTPNNDTLNCKNQFVNEDEIKFSTLLRLKGGGESSVSNGTSAWGTPPSQPSNNNNAKMTTNTAQASSENVWGQSGAKTLSNTSAPAPNQLNASPTSTQNNKGPSSTTKQQLEQLHSLREALFSQDGWGVQFVNQDPSWDVPTTPEPTTKADGSNSSTPWKPPVNNGTELWEANLRTGGQPPPQQHQKVPWGHTPSSNIGGTWGEDEEAESTNVWPAANPNQQQWNGSGNSNENTMWNGPKKGEDWNGNTNNNWREPRVADPRQMTDTRDIRPGIRGATNTETIRLLDHIETMRQMPTEMRGDPRGITGRLNGSGTEAFWGQSSHVNSQSMSRHKISGPSNNMGWDEIPSSSQNRIQPNFDDGTSLWGNPQQGSHWKDLSSTGNITRNIPGSIGMNQPRMKPDSSAWGNGRSGSWEEAGNQPATWDEPGPWMKQKMPSNHLWENDLDWNQKPNKLHLTKEMIYNSKQFRMLLDMGHKKEDIESALRAREMNLDEALDLLNAMRRTDNWGLRHDDHYEHVPLGGNLKYPVGSNVPLTNFPPSNNDPSLLNSMNANNSLLNNISSAYVQKVLQGGGPHNLGNNLSVASRNLQSPPSTQQLKMLVGQIQMAVQAGFLNNQILNQPLAPQTLAMLNQLLQQIKNLQQLMAQQSILSTYTVNGKPNNAYVQYSLLIAKTKQAIGNMQNQISTQQAAYLKQQLGDPLKPSGMHDSVSGLQNNFANLGINKEPITTQQSKLNQWINKDKEGNEFSRAPGSTSKLSANVQFGMNTPDGPWSTRRNVDANWSDGTGETTNEKDAQWTTPQASITDLVPEFEPGKPWKGNQLKSIEDDPTITPGSVVRSPLSIPTIKDAWSNNAQTSTANTFTSPSVKLQTSNNGLTDPNNTSTVTPDLWTTPAQPKGPPGFPSENWYNNIANSAPWGVNQQNSGNTTAAGSTWLLLRNLTAQIDGSTLRTLCMQHGPLMSFNLYLYQGFALAKYSSREEAIKAQIALNNCLLGNTTILAESPSDWDANNLIQQLASQQNNSSGNWRGSNKQTSTDTWNTNWPNNSANPWSATLDCNEPRGTPSNLNSFLPNDLLGGESI